MKNLLFTTILTLLCPLSISQVHIYGKAPQYANESCIVYTYKDYITKIEEKIDTLRFDETGDFSFRYTPTQTTLIYFTLHRFKIFLYTEPGKIYQIKLPPKIKKTAQQKLNPFFKESETIAGILNTDKNELNALIQKFDNELDKYVDQNIENIYGQEIITTRQYIKKLQIAYENLNNQFFTQYVKYRLGFLDFLMRPNKTVQLRREFFDDEKIIYNNPAYSNLLKKIYEQHLFKTFNNHKTKHFKQKIVSTRNSISLKNSINQLIGSSSIQLNEYIFLILLRDAYNDRVFTLDETNNILNQFIRFSDKKNNEIATNFKAHINYLSKGSKAPDFSLPDNYGNIRGVNSFKGKFLLVNISDINSTACLAELTALKEIYESYGNQLEIVSIFNSHDKQKTQEYVKKQNCGWTILFADERNEVYKKYRIHTLPSYILIDEDGKIVRAPAPTVYEGLSIWIEKIMN